jgi:hypothetical protein
MAKMHTKDTAIDGLMHMGKSSLAEICYYAHKDQYGTKGHHLLDKSVPELVSWYITHYFFDENHQCWTPVIPFENNF